MCERERERLAAYIMGWFIWDSNNFVFVWAGELYQSQLQGSHLFIWRTPDSRFACPIHAEMHESFIRLGSSSKVCGCYSVHSSCSPNFYRLSLHNRYLCCTRQLYDEAFAKIGRKNQTSFSLVIVIGSACLLVPLCIILHTMVKGHDHVTMRVFQIRLKIVSWNIEIWCWVVVSFKM